MKREISIDILRIVAIALIFCFHFCCTFGFDSNPMYGYANGGWGAVGTTIFYIISGYTLSMKYKDISGKENVCNFYRKRFRAMFPSLWLIFLIGYLVNAISLAGFEYGGSPIRLIYSILGIDGYVNMLGYPSYYVTGEWYTAVILVIYLIFPVLAYLFRKCRICMVAAVAVLYTTNIMFWSDRISPDASVITGVAMFTVGMLLQHYSDSLRKSLWPVPLCAVIGLVIVFVPLPYYRYQLPYKNLLAVCIFILVYILAHTIESRMGRPDGIVVRLINMFASMTLEIYLLHHFVLRYGYICFGGSINSMKCVLGFFVITLAITVIGAYIVHGIFSRKKEPLK